MIRREAAHNILLPTKTLSSDASLVNISSPINVICDDSPFISCLVEKKSNPGHGTSQRRVR